VRRLAGRQGSGRRRRRSDVVARDTASSVAAVDPARAERLERDLAAAIGRRDSSPDDPDAWVWVGRRLGYLGRFREAVRVYDEAVGRFPKDAALLRHRGHRHLTLRNFPAATADLARAWELAKDAPDVVEPDGAPTPGVPPRSTLKSNILYHLGLSWYFRGNFDEAAEVFGRAVALGVNDDARVAANWWRCLSLARIGDKPGLAAALALVRAPDVLGGMDVRETPPTGICNSFGRARGRRIHCRRRTAPRTFGRSSDDRLRPRATSSPPRRAPRSDATGMGRDSEHVVGELRAHRGRSRHLPGSMRHARNAADPALTADVGVRASTVSPPRVPR
jgi:Flp pilus assembly protein TadD